MKSSSGVQSLAIFAAIAVVELLVLLNGVGVVPAAIHVEARSRAQAGGDVRALTKALNAALNGRGGGKPGICQGSCAAEPEQVKEFLRKTK